MNENITNNNDAIEEVPLDLFDQVSLDETESVEVVDLNEPKQEENNETSSSNTVISIPASAYEAALASMNNSEGPQSSN